MDKTEIFKRVKNDYQVVVHHDCSNFDEVNMGKILIGDKDKTPLWCVKERYVNSEEKFVEHFADKLACVHHIKYTAVMEKSEEKISLKYFYNEKFRKPGVHWFRKNRFMRFVTLNLKTGIFYSGNITRLHTKKPKKQIFTNKFYNGIDDVFDIISYHFAKSHDMEVRKNMFSDLVRLFISQIPDWPFDDIKEKNVMCNPSGVKFYQYYLMKRRVKIPNNFLLFEGYDFCIPTKLFKKAKNKYIDALMLYHNFYGDGFRKAFHELKRCPTSLQTIKFIISMVGKTRIEKDYDMLLHFLTLKNSVPNQYDVEWITEAERKNIWMVLKTLNTSLITIRDHIHFLGFLRNRGMIYKWKAKNAEQFIIEHKLVSDTYDAIKNGITHRVYPKEYYEYFDSPINVNNIDYTVKILDKQTEFYQESDIQQNCIKTYITKPASFLISVRNGKERATVEYKISSKKNKITTDRIQFLGRFNKSLPESWNDVLHEIDNKVTDMINDQQYKMKLQKVQNGITNSFNLVFDTEGQPIWDNPLELVNDIDYF